MVAQELSYVNTCYHATEFPHFGHIMTSESELVDEDHGMLINVL